MTDLDPDDDGPEPCCLPFALEGDCHADDCPTVRLIVQDFLAHGPWAFGYVMADGERILLLSTADQFRIV
jgi:hypothetical protein